MSSEERLTSAAWSRSLLPMPFRRKLWSTARLLRYATPSLLYNWPFIFFMGTNCPVESTQTVPTMPESSKDLSNPPCRRQRNCPNSLGRRWILSAAEHPSIASRLVIVSFNTCQCRERVVFLPAAQLCCSCCPCQTGMVENDDRGPGQAGLAHTL